MSGGSVRQTAMIDLFDASTRFAHQAQQTIGENSDYYVTIDQLNALALALMATSKPDRG